MKDSRSVQRDCMFYCLEYGMYVECVFARSLSLSVCAVSWRICVRLRVFSSAMFVALHTKLNVNLHCELQSHTILTHNSYIEYHH